MIDSKNISFYFGAILIILGFFCNKFILEYLFATDGNIDSGSISTIILAFQVALILMGMFFVYNKPAIVFSSQLNYFLLVISIAGSITAAEVVSRILTGFTPYPPNYVGEHQNRPSHNFIVDEDTGWKMKPLHSFKWGIGGHDNLYRSNSMGFRSDNEFTVEKGTQNIIFVGDSFTFGTGVNYQDTFGALIEKRFQSTNVYNLAMPGFGIDQMWMSVKHQALELQPKLIVVSFVDQDFDRSLTAFRKTEGFNKPTFILEGKLLPRTPADRPNHIIKYIEQNSYLWSALQINKRKMGFTYPIGNWWKLNAAIFTAINEECLKRDISLLFIRLPTEDAKDFITLELHMKKIGVPYLDLAVTSAQSNKNIFISGDGHINIYGHRYVAKAINTWIESNMPQLNKTN